MFLIFFAGFIKMFSNVAHLTLDLSNNKMETLPATVLYENATNWEHQGTQILKGRFFKDQSMHGHTHKIFYWY
jgi:hypothetical protein